MRFAALPILLLAVLGFGPGPSTTKNVDLGEEFTIKNGQQVVVRGEKLRITFGSVNSDSRCPSGVACVWAGNAEISVEVSKKHKKQVVASLNTALEPKEINYKTFKIKLLGLNPYPKYNEPTDPNDYEATMIVTKDD